MKKTTFIALVIALFFTTSAWPTFFDNGRLNKSTAYKPTAAWQSESFTVNFPWIFFPYSSLPGIKSKIIKTGDSESAPKDVFDFSESNLSNIAPLPPMSPLYPLHAPQRVILFTENIPGQRRRFNPGNFGFNPYRIELVF